VSGDGIFNEDLGAPTLIAGQGYFVYVNQDSILAP
jgi:hypothetical protein